MKLGARSAWLTVAFSLLGCAVLGCFLWRLTPRPTPLGKNVHPCAPGVWGQMRYVDALVEPPESYVNVTALATNPTSWFMDVFSLKALKQKLRGNGLHEELIEALQQCAAPAANGAGYLLQPPDELVIGLSPGDRANLYGLLACHTQNVAHAVPFRFDLKTRKDWFEQVHLEPAVETLVRKLVYRQGNMRLFSDLPLVMRRHPDPELYARLFRALSREATVEVYLHVAPDDNVKELAHYWGWPGREEAVAIRLKAAQAAGAVRDVPLAQLLPPFAREHLNRYPTATDPDFSSCHYSCMNFFNAPPDLRFTNHADVVEALRRDYLEVPNTEYQLGDVILLTKKGEGVIHSCNYIADHLVFTKNGGSLVRPWVLARLDDLVSFYSYPKPVTVRAMRRRDALKHSRAPRPVELPRVKAA